MRIDTQIFFSIAFVYVILFYCLVKLRTKNNKLEKENIELKEQVENLGKNITSLKSKIQYNKFELKNIEHQHEKEIEKIQNEKCKDKLERITNEFIEKEFEDFDNEIIVKLMCRNAPSSLEKAKLAEKIAKECEKKCKIMEYEYYALFELFPELEGYIERFDKSSEEQFTFNELQSDYDYSAKYLSKEEYEKLGEDERNQLALDRYIERKNKSKWQIGRDYELYIGYLYEKDGYRVKYTGIEQKLEDMGRDLIAENGKEILIIQCKNWSKEKVIHEKHICQLYGTTIHYKKTYNPNKKIKAVFVTSTQLSDKAKEFAKYLKVKVFENKDLEEFPRIKCNINKGNKIYHLPFDQQYDKTIIEKENGESFEFRVKDAVGKGFRRAKKYYP